VSVVRGSVWKWCIKRRLPLLQW